MTKGAAIHYAHENIRMNSIHPSTVNTPLVENLFQNPEMKKARYEEVPMGRLASVRDVANAAIFLASDESSFITGAALPVEHIRSLRRLLPHVRIYSMFGLTECKRVGYLPPEEIDNKPSSVGMAMPNCETFILDDDGNQLPPGQTGELVIRGSNVMQGYWKSPELTARTYRDREYPAGRRLHSGDYFHKDKESFLYFVGRKDDMIKSKGERISPKEVENNISAMDGVVEVAIIGVSDEILGQAIKAFIVPASGKELTERDVLRFCTQNMESFMVPKYILFMDELPRTPNGKIDKKRLEKQQGE